MSDMADVLARRNFEAEYDDLQWDELTEPVKQGWRKDAQDSLDFLSAAGFGPVQEALAEAWDEGFEMGEDYGEWSGAPVRNRPSRTNPYREDT